MIDAPKEERKIGIGLDLIFCKICRNENLSFFDDDSPCKECKMIITNFEAV